MWKCEVFVVYPRFISNPEIDILLGINIIPTLIIRQRQILCTIYFGAFTFVYLSLNIQSYDEFDFRADDIWRMIIRQEKLTVGVWLYNPSRCPFIVRIYCLLYFCPDSFGIDYVIVCMTPMSYQIEL